MLHLIWNQLPASLCQPRTNLHDSNSPVQMTGTFSSIDSPLSSSITPSLFHSRFQTSFSTNPARVAFFFCRTDSTDSMDCLPILLSTYIFIFSFFLYHFLLCACMWLIKLTYVRFQAHVKLVYCIVSYHIYMDEHTFILPYKSMV